MTITIKDVARMAGVSISTVSRVINNSKPVSSEIRDKVLEVIKETNYVPNPVARSLVLRKSNAIGVIVPDISDGKIGEILNGIEEVAKIYDYDILLCNSYGEFEEESRYINLLKNKQVAGIVFVSRRLTEEAIDMLEKSYIPTIYVSRNAKDFDIPSIGIDHKKAGKTAAEYIANKNFKSVGIFELKGSDSEKDSYIVDSFIKYIDKKKISYIKEAIISKKGKVQDAYNFMDAFIKGNNKLPEILFATSDEVAVGLLNALLDNNIDVPDKVSILGYDNSNISKYVRPQLTTISQPLYDIGAIAIGVLIKKIEGTETEILSKILDHGIVERQSVK